MNKQLFLCNVWYEKTEDNILRRYETPLPVFAMQESEVEGVINTYYTSLNNDESFYQVKNITITPALGMEALFKEYYLEEDGDGHHYVIPATKQSRFAELEDTIYSYLEGSDEYNDAIDALNDEFSQYMTGGAPASKVWLTDLEFTQLTGTLPD